MKFNHIYLVLSFIICNAFTCKATISDSLFLTALQNSDTTFTREYLDQTPYNVDKTLGKNQVTPLVLSVLENNALLTRILIEEYNADVELMWQDMTPLMHASGKGSTEVIEMLIDNNCKVDAQNSHGNTAFIYATKFYRLNSLQTLHRLGANINKQNNSGYTALDFSIINNSSQITHYLDSIGAKIFPKTISSTVDGPYMWYSEQNQIESLYLKYDSLESRYGLIRFNSKANDSGILKTGYEPDKNSYYIPDEFEPAPSEFSDVDSVFTIGDIHGQYDRMIKMLKHGEVIDDNLGWNFGKGHVVFVGDIQDRGDKVTEAYWFIYRLETEAKKYGGRVHLLLGNHEVMVLRNDLRYVAPKYYALTSGLNLKYNELYDQNTVLGRWLRSKNGIVKINGDLFAHAGISPELCSKKISIDSVNSVLRSVLTESKIYPEELETLIMRSYGPIWYRGYFKESRKYSMITEEELDNILSYYQASRIIVGHTEFDTVKSHFNNKVISVNLPLWNDSINEQALLIKNGKYYHLESQTENMVLLFK